MISKGSCFELMASETTFELERGDATREEGKDLCGSSPWIGVDGSGTSGLRCEGDPSLASEISDGDTGLVGESWRTGEAGGGGNGWHGGVGSTANSLRSSLWIRVKVFP